MASPNCHILDLKRVRSSVMGVIQNRAGLNRDEPSMALEDGSFLEEDTKGLLNEQATAGLNTGTDTGTRAEGMGFKMPQATRGPRVGGIRTQGALKCLKAQELKALKYIKPPMRTMDLFTASVKG